MRLISTRNGASASSISEAIRVGLAGDGGLFIPDEFPEGQLSGLTAQTSLKETALTLFEPFFKGDQLESVLPELVEETYDFDIPLVNPHPGRPGVFALELFHGPTGAFKDVGARFLLRCLDKLGDPNAPFTVLAATSGDTGGAVGCAAEGRKGVRAVILYAKGRISAFQERQLTCWNAPVTALEVEGDFDACQRMVKAAFADRALSERHNLTSANSINIARLLPQAAYMAWAARQAYEKNGVKPGLIIPTGNLGHGVAAIWARHMGAPWGPIVLATNANRTLADWSISGRYEPRASIATLANAMDVGAPSNFERLNALPDDAARLSVELVEDRAIRARIKADFSHSGYVWCPHSAVAAEALARMREFDLHARPWVIAATAHPYKFADVVEPLIGQTLEPSEALAEVLDRPTRSEPCGADLDALRHHLNALNETA